MIRDFFWTLKTSSLKKCVTKNCWPPPQKKNVNRPKKMLTLQFRSKKFITNFIYRQENVTPNFFATHFQFIEHQEILIPKNLTQTLS